MKKISLEEERTTKKLDQVRLMLLISGVFLFIYYTLNDIQETGSYDKTPILCGCIAALFVGLGLHYFKKRMLANLFYLIPATFFMSFLVIDAGGLQAPGTFWFSLIPVAWGFLMGKRGVIIGYGSVVVVFAYMYLNKDNIHLPPQFQNPEMLSQARMENLLLFTTSVFVFIFVYTQILDKAQNKVEEKKQEVATLLKILVHDVSNPLCIANGMAEILKETKSYDDDMMKKIMMSFGKMNQIVTDVRRLFAISDGKLTLKKTDVRLKDCVDDALGMLSTIVEKKNIVVKVNEQSSTVISSIDKSIFANQVLLNLLNNSVKFCDTENGEIAIEIYSSGNKNHIEIIDNGIGIPDTLLPKLFDYDTQTSREGTSGEKGTGFGLPIVKRILEQLDGEIEVTSPPSKVFRKGTMTKITFTNSNK